MLLRRLTIALVFTLAVTSCSSHNVRREQQAEETVDHQSEARAESDLALSKFLDESPDRIPQAFPAPDVPTSYVLRVTFQEQPARIAGTETILYTNNTQHAVDRLFIRLLPNSDVYKWDIGPGGEANTGKPLIPPGAIQIWDLNVEGAAARSVDINPTTVEITLPRQLAPGDQTKLDLKFATSIPSTNTLGRLSLTGETVELGYWFPHVAVLDRSGWNLDPLLPIGDSLYTEVADFDVSLELPDGWQGVATGSKAPMIGRNNNVKASLVRDFTVVLSRSWGPALTSEINGTTVLVVAPRDFANMDELLDVSVDALTTFGRLFGQYPYDSLVVVGGVGGIEGPGLSVSGDGGDRVLIHTIAHQWWYAAVGNNKVRSIWDEGLATYSETLYDEFGQFAITPWNYAKFGPQGCLNRTLFSFLNQSQRPLDDYLRVQYAGGALWFSNLRARLGDERFFELLRSFYATHRFGIATWDEWRTAIGGEYPELENAIQCSG